MSTLFVVRTDLVLSIDPLGGDPPVRIPESLAGLKGFFTQKDHPPELRG